MKKCFQFFPGCEKYFVDMSGKGEPLLALKTIIGISRWCQTKQDKIRRQVLPQFVCNGTFLTQEIADTLQRHGILFGVSVDGNKMNHDLHRRDLNGAGSFDLIMKNVKSISHKEYIGCAGTLTKDVFFPFLNQ